MKPFSLEEYLKNPEKKMVSRDGRSVKIICTDRKNLNHPIVALIENILTEGEGVLCYTKEGKIFNQVSNDADLFFASEKREGWINIFKNDSVFPDIYETQDLAKEYGMHRPDYIDTIKIEWEE